MRSSTEILALIISNRYPWTPLGGEVPCLHLFCWCKVVAFVEQHIGNTISKVLFEDECIVRNYQTLVRTLIENLNLLIAVAIGNVSNRTGAKHNFIVVVLIKILGCSRVNQKHIVCLLHFQLCHSRLLVVKEEFGACRLSKFDIGVECEQNWVCAIAQLRQRTT